MTIVNYKIKTKFGAGQKVYYKLGKSKVRHTTVKRVEIKTVLRKGKGPTTKVVYIARAKDSRYRHYSFDRSFKEEQLYSEAEAEKKLLPAIKKKNLMEKIKSVKRNIVSNKKSAAKAKKALEKIRKEELIEELAGIK